MTRRSMRRIYTYLKVMIQFTPIGSSSPLALLPSALAIELV